MTNQREIQKYFGDEEDIKERLRWFDRIAIRGAERRFTRVNILVMGYLTARVICTANAHFKDVLPLLNMFDGYVLSIEETQEC